MTWNVDIALMLGLGALTVLVAWLPLALAKLPLSVPILCVALGWVLGRTQLLPFEIKSVYVAGLGERFTEIALLVALMGAGLKIDRPFGLRAWASAWRLLGIAMPLTLLLLMLACVYGGGYTWAAAALVSSALAPTDPVLASDVSLGPPGVGEEGEVRFALTAEAGMNDGLALPFVMLSVAASAHELIGPAWLAQHFLWKILLAVGLGWLIGKVFGILTFHLPSGSLSETGDGLVALGVTLVAYGLVEMLGGYGFVAVFCTAVSLREVHRDSPFHVAMAEFASQIERLLAMIIIVLFGAALAHGLLRPLQWPDVLVGLSLLFLIRPAAGMLSLLGSPHRFFTRAAAAFFGIRGIGTIYYLLYASSRAHFAQLPRLMALAGFVVLCSIVLHGLTSTPLMRRLDELRERAMRRRSSRSHAGSLEHRSWP